MNRFLILFAREPRREALAKGFGPGGEDLFAGFAAGWFEAATLAGARFVLATPPEDRAAWRSRLPGDADALWIGQHGSSFGERLEGVARRASRLGGRAILIGGDVAPCDAALVEAFAALENGADAVLAPAADGGVSLLGLRPDDVDLLSAIAPRQRGVVDRLRRRLSDRGRSVALVAPAPDVDGRRSLVSLLRGFVLRQARGLARQILRQLSVCTSGAAIAPPAFRQAGRSGPRAPPLAA